MIRINLLPVKRIKEREAVQKQAAGFVIGLVFLLAALGLMALHFTQKIASIRQDIQTIENEKKQYEAVLALIKDLNAKKADYEKKMEVIAQLRQEAQIPVRILDEVANTIPVNRLWLRSLSQADKTLQLAGVALDNATIADYMRNIDQSPYFSEPDLSRSSLEVVAEQKLKTFALACSVEAPAAKGEQESQQAEGVKKSP